MHDQILISQHDTKEPSKETDFETVKVTSFNSDIDLTSQMQPKPKSKLKEHHAPPKGNKAPMTSRADPGSKRKNQYLEHFITVKVQNRNPTPTGRFTATDSLKVSEVASSHLFSPK